MFAGEGSGTLLGGALKATPPDAVMLGGDTRYLRLFTPQYVQTIPMQNDVEVAVRASDEMTFAASAGRYGASPEVESRRFYALWTPNEYVAARVGRWIPNYGLMVPDHSTVTKKYLDFDQEDSSFNAELSARSQYGELFFTVAAPAGTTVELKGDPAPSTKATVYSYITRGAAYIGERAQVGLSYRAMAHPDLKWHHTVGAFGTWGVTRDLYMMAEYDRDFEFIDAGEARDVGFGEIGYEVFRGVNLLANYEYYDRASMPGVGLQLFPVPHIELLARVKYQNKQAVPVLMFHSNW